MEEIFLQYTLSNELNFSGIKVIIDKDIKKQVNRIYGNNFKNLIQNTYKNEKILFSNQRLCLYWDNKIRYN